MFDWDKVTNDGIHKETMKFTSGLIELRRSTDAFRLGNQDLVANNVSLIESDDILKEDLVLFFKSTSTDGKTFYVLVNADSNQRTISVDMDLSSASVLVDSDEAGMNAVESISGVTISSDKITVDPLTVVVIKSE